jgi:hypothetical protein
VGWLYRVRQDSQKRRTMKSILDRTFKYTPASKTDLSVTFRRVRKELAEQAIQTSKVVRPLKKEAK